MKRIPESGPMDDLDEVVSYDQLSKKHLGLVEDNFVKRSLKLLSECDNPGRHVVVDAGIGPGNIPIRFIKKNPAPLFVGVDMSIPMLQKARKNLDNEDISGNIHLVCADMTRLPFRDGAVDLVTSHSTMHHLVDIKPALNEIVRITRKGGRFIIRDLRRPPGWLIWLYVLLFGMPYTPLMKKMYRESLEAGFTFREMKRIGRGLSGAAVKARRFFVTHVGLEGRREKM